jgi:hypothetical protein
MQHFDLTEDEAAALAALLIPTIADDRYQFSPRIRTLKGILAKPRPEPLPPPKIYAPPRTTAARRRRVRR